MFFFISRLCTWAKSGLVGDESLSEKPVAQKIRKMGKTLFPEIIAEFMNKRQRLPTSINPWKKPLLSRAQVLCHLAADIWTDSPRNERYAQSLQPSCACEYFSFPGLISSIHLSAINFKSEVLSVPCSVLIPVIFLKSLV